MIRASCLLKFSSPARAFEKFFPVPSTIMPSDRNDLLFRSKPMTFNLPCHLVNIPPGRSVTLYCTDTLTKDCVLRYCSGGAKDVHNLAFGPRQACRMTNSCDGLVGVYGRDRFWIANPSIPRVAALPRCSPHVPRSRPDYVDKNDMPRAAIALSEDASTYKVVRIFTREHAGPHRSYGPLFTREHAGPHRSYGALAGNHLPVSLGCEVLSLEKEERRRCWKPVEDPPELTIPMGSMPVVVGRHVYWRVRTEPESLYGKCRKMIRSKLKRSAIALCFDTREEKFSLLLHPKGWRKQGASMLFLGAGGRLCLVDAQGQGGVTLWRLEDRESSEWVRLGDLCYPRGWIFPSRYCRAFRKVSYDLQTSTVDYHDVPTLLFLYQEAVDETEFGSATERLHYFMTYIAHYTSTNIWPF